MKKLILVLAAALALSLLCSCAKPLPEEPVQADPEPEAPAEVHVTTFTADILSSDSDTLSVRPADEDPAFGAAEAVTVTLADNTVYPYRGLVDFAEPQVDPRTGTFSVRAEMPNASSCPGSLRKCACCLT